MKYRAVPAFLSIAVGLSGASVAAQSYTVKLGGAHIDPRATSSEFSGTLPGPRPVVPGVTLDVSPKSTLVFSIERHLNDQLSLELALGLPPKHDVKLRASEALLGGTYGPLAAFYYGQFADGTIATVKQVAPTLFLNYRFGSAGDVWRPYLGLGINYTRLKATLTNTGRTFYQGVPMDLSLTDSWGPALQLGMSYRITKQWSLNAQVASAVVETKLRVRGGGGEHQATFEFTPTVWMATVGYSF